MDNDNETQDKGEEEIIETDEPLNKTDSKCGKCGTLLNEEAKPIDGQGVLKSCQQDNCPHS